MAEETTDRLVTPAKSGLDNMGKNSAGNPGGPVINESDYLNIGNLSAHDRASIRADDTRDNARRNSSEMSDSTKIRRYVVPHYLRASTGSCHDICKYGRRHESDETARKPLRKGIIKRSPNEQHSMEVIVSDTQKKEKVGHELSAVAKKRLFIVKPSSDAKSYSPRFRTSLDGKASSSNKTHLSDSTSKKSISSYPPEVIKREVVLPSKKVEVPVKEGSSIDTKTSRMSVKHSSLLKLKSAKVEPLSASDNSDGVHGKARRNGDVSTVRKMTVSASAKKVLLPSSAPSSPKFSLVKTTLCNARKEGRLKLSSCLKGPERVHKVGNEISKSEASEKTLRVIKIGMDNDASEPVPDDCAIPVLPSPSSRNSFSRAKFPCMLSHEEDDEEIKFCGNEADEVVSDNTVSMDAVEVQPANENHNKTLGTGTENKARESIANHRSSPKSLSHEEDEGNEADEFVSDKTESMETVKIQPVKEKRDKIPISGTENDASESIPDDNVPLPSSSSSDTSSHASSSSLFSHEEDDEQITHANSEPDEVISDNTIPVETVKEQPMKQNHYKTLRKSRPILSEDKHRSPMKLKFRSGRVLDIKPENKTPRRLKFRRTRVNTNTTDDYISDKKKSIEIGSPQHVKENRTKSSRKSRVLVSEDKYRSPIKVFRTEKSLDPQSDNNNLRKLRFRRAREIGAEDTKSDSRRRIFKRAGDKNDAAGAELSSREVTLKHQDLQGKRDAQGLLNNVIEETASKLVESRKSKVKALVGAFETVISLQEKKPSLRSVG